MKSLLLIAAYISGLLALAPYPTPSCGAAQPCFRSPEGCSGSDCDYAVSYCPRGDYVDFTVGVTLTDDTGPNFYMAFGVNETPERSDGSVVDCIHYEGVSYVRMSWNAGSKNYLVDQDLSNRTLDDSLSQCSYVGRYFECSFSRLVTVEVPPGYKEYIADLSPGNRYFIKVAKGNASSTIRKEYHGPNGRTVSKVKHDFGELPDIGLMTSETGTSVTIDSPVARPSGCGISKGCYSVPSGCQDANCQYHVTYVTRGDVIDFEVTAQIPPELGADVYACLGFNHQKKMDDAFAVDCISYHGDVGMQLSRNKGHANLVIQDIHSVLSASDAQNNVSDGYFTCGFSLKRSTQRAAYLADLWNPEGHYLLLAVGPSNSLRDKGDHGHNVHVSQDRIDFSSTLANEPTPYFTPANCILASVTGVIVIRFFTRYMGGH